MRKSLLAGWAGIVALAGAVAAPAGDGSLGYRGRGDCVEPAGNPPVHWDVRSGENVLWRARLPNWGYGSPIELAGRVFLMCEPDREHDFPYLLCLDAADGRMLWQRELDHIAMMDLPPARREKVRKAWHEFLALDRKLYRMSHVYRTTQDKDEARKKVTQAGLAVGGKGPGKVGVPDPKAYFGGLVKTFNRAELYFEVWHWSSLHCIGYAFPTPVTDGQHVYVATGLHGFACYDGQGELLWQQFVPGRGSSNAGYGGNDYCKNARSPLLYEDLLISDVGDRVRAFDKRTGRLVWSRDLVADPKWNTHTSMVSPVILTVGGTDVLMCYGPKAYRLPGGRPSEVTGWSNPGAAMLVRRDRPDTVFFTGGGEHGGWKGKGNCENPPPAAVRFALRDGTLEAEVLWSGIEGRPLRRHTGLVCHDGKLYHPRGLILDAETGKVLAGSTRKRHRKIPRAAPETRHFLWIAGGHVYGVREYKPKKWGRQRYEKPCALSTVHTLAGEKAAENVLPIPEPTGQKRERIIEATGHPGWGFSFGCPFAVVGDRLYIRSNDFLWCIGRQ